MTDARPIPPSVLVTGGAGFVGANLVPALLAAGARVRVLDDCTTGDPSRLADEVELVRGDVRDADAVRAATEGVDAVVHLAAAGSVIQSIEDPATNFDINARGTLTVLTEAQAAGVGRFVFASTGGALIGNAPPPVDETSVPRPISPYGASKLSGEGYCHAFHGAYGLPTIALRFANVYGPHSERKRGAVTTFIHHALAGEPITIHGDGSATRDFLHSDDLVRGIVAALSSDVTGVVHLASERETSIEELARLILTAAGADVDVEHRPARRGEVERNFALARRAAEELGWRADVDLAEGMAETVEWFRRHAARAPAT
ncbi:MAG: NAD-dependent epimerase/dehydratase family protein [Solirubrobacteraceae bacterium]